MSSLNSVPFVVIHTCPRADIVGFGMSKMELLSFFVIFLSREPFRLAALRHREASSSAQPPAKASSSNSSTSSPSSGTDPLLSQSLVNLSWCGLPVGVLLSLATIVHFARSDWGGEGVEGNQSCILFFLLACLLELASEPAYIAAQLRLQYGVRAKVESLANVTKCLATFLFVVVARWGVVGFGLAQVMFAGVLAVGFWRNSVLSHNGSALQLLPRRFVDHPVDESADKTQAMARRPLVWLDGHARRMLQAFSMQTLFKFLMSESDKLVMTYSSGLYEQGVYAVVTNYGKYDDVCSLPELIHPSVCMCLRASLCVCLFV
jgi:oligosaccharide translocation protein RFT1